LRRIPISRDSARRQTRPTSESGLHPILAFVLDALVQRERQLNASGSRAHHNNAEQGVWPLVSGSLDDLIHSLTKGADRTRRHGVLPDAGKIEPRDR
jgi:hypothetical protein